VRQSGRGAYLVGPASGGAAAARTEFCAPALAPNRQRCAHCHAARSRKTACSRVRCCVNWQASELVQYEQYQPEQQVEYASQEQGVPANWQQLTPVSAGQAQQLAGVEPSTAFSVSCTTEQASM